MKSSYQKILDHVRATLLPPAEQGISGEEVKQVIIHLLSPYFVNKDILEEAAILILAPEAVNISRINNDAWAKEMFLHVLEDYHKAAETDKNACFVGWASWDKKILHGSSEYVSLLNLHLNLDELSLDDFRFEVFRNIGALIEANLQPYLKELLLQIRIRLRKMNPAHGLETMTLGDAIDELCQHSGYEELFAPPPWGIRLNQWRNMAQHHKTRVEKDRILGTYGTGSNEREVIFIREELLNGLKRIQSILSILKGARSIFFVDHINEMRPYFTDAAAEARDDIKIFHLASSLATQGFDLNDLSIDETSVNAIVQDVTELPLNEQMIDYKRKRIIHSSQFVYAIWSYFPLDLITIKHLDNQGNLRCTISGKGSDCEAISKGEMPFEELAERVVLTLASQM